MKTDQAFTYDEIRPHLETFSIINCLTVKTWRPSTWFWNAIGHTLTIYKDLETESIFAYESTQRSYSGTNGVHLQFMSDWIQSYPGLAFVRLPIFQDKELRARAIIHSPFHVKDYRGTPYPNLKTHRGRRFVANASLDNPLFKMWNENPDIDSVMFCTMLVAHFWKACGLTKPDLNPAEMEPDDTRPGGNFEKWLVDGVTLGPELLITPYGKESR